jgi:hypothetical protein
MHRAKWPEEQLCSWIYSWLRTMMALRRGNVDGLPLIDPYIVCKCNFGSGITSTILVFLGRMIRRVVRRLELVEHVTKYHGSCSCDKNGIRLSTQAKVCACCAIITCYHVLSAEGGWHSPRSRYLRLLIARPVRRWRQSNRRTPRA